MTHMTRNERGLTLMELTVVFVLATLVMVGLVGFYLNSQATWVDGSTQAQTQREETLLVGMMADSIHRAEKAIVTTDPVGGGQIVTLYTNNVAWYAFWWSSSDSTIHGRLEPSSSDAGPLMLSKVTQFQVQSVGDTLIILSLLEARTGGGELVRTATSFVACNR
jgi:Tfp pilus assembly protein PilV